jgi:hypothetical protein
MSTTEQPNDEMVTPSEAPNPLLPDAWLPLAAEVTTYFRELPRLLREGEANRWALIKGNEVQSIWDSFRDARQYGYERFGLDVPFMTQKIDPRDLKRFAPYFPPRPDEEEGDELWPS